MKRKHIFFTLGLSLAMGLGVAAATVGSSRVSPTKALYDAEYKFVYLTKPADWTAVKVHNWGVSGNRTTWESPEDAKKVQTNNGFGQEVYKTRIDLANYEKLIFRGDGSKQSSDLDFDKTEGAYKNYNAVYLDGTWKGYTFTPKYSLTGNGSFIEGDFANDIDLTGNDESASITIALEAGDVVKLRENHQWGSYYGYDQLDTDSKAYFTADGDRNMVLAASQDGLYHFVFKAFDAFTGTGSYFTVEKLTSKSVELIVDGASQGNQNIALGELPGAPTMAYGKSFNGKWYTDSECTVECDGVTAGTNTLYAKTTATPTKSYYINLDSNDNFNDSNLRLWAWQDGGRQNTSAAFPGDVTILGRTITVPEDARFLIAAAGEPVKQTVNVTPSAVNNDWLRVLPSTDGEGHFNVAWGDEAPHEDGYYLSGTAGWDYRTAVQMTSVDSTLDPNQNSAILEGLSITAINTQVRVRSYFAPRLDPADHDYDKWATYGGEAKDFGNVVGGEGADQFNFNFTKTGTYNVYAKYVEDQFKFFIERQADFVIEMTAVLFNGKVKDTTAALDNQSAFIGEDFNPVQPARDGYVARGVFTDEACTTDYSAHEFNANGHLYIKYTKIAWYIAGDATYSGSEGLKWSVDAASIMVAPASGNLLEGTIVIPAGADKDHPVDVKPMSYELDNYGNPKWNGQYDDKNLSMGGSYDFVTRIADDATGDDELNRGNLRFTKSGSFSIFVNSTRQIYITEGLDAFFSGFLAQVGDVCDAQGNTNPSSLAAVWTQQKVAFDSLGALADSLKNNPTKFKHYDNPANDEEKMLNLYHYIITKYGTNAYEDFIWKQELPSSGRIKLISNTVNSTTIAVVATVMSVIAGATIAFFVLRKKKEQR